MSSLVAQRGILPMDDGDIGNGADSYEINSNEGENSFSLENGPRGLASAYKTGYHYKVFGKDTDSNCYVTTPTLVTPEEEDDELVDWNEEFQQLVETISSKGALHDTLRTAYGTLSRLMQDFVHVCKTYAKVLVHEKSLSLRHKTIKPAAVGGYAGGLKYLHAGIMFKFSSSDPYNIYGSDERAAKAALHELKGLREVFECRAGVSVPLLAVIDYCGHRILCSSILPLDHLVYGSSNGGKTVFASHTGFNEKMRSVGQTLNLQGHYAGVSSNPQDHQLLYAPCDIEGHIGVDGRSYVLDLHRLFPPEAPTRPNSNEFLYRLLRPEFVRSYPKPLCSDAFSKFTTIDAESYKQEVRLATEVLRTKLIPQLGRFLDSLEASAESNTSNLRLAELLHRRGINLRHLGLVRASTTKPNIRRALLLEMVARSLKNDLNAHLRHAVSTSKHPSNGPYKNAIVNFFNRILSMEQAFWTTHVKQLLNEYFPDGLAPSESLKTYSLRNVLLLPSARPLFMRLQALTGIKLTESAEKQLDLANLEIVVQDIGKLSTKVHSPDFITSIEGMTLYIQSSKSTGPQADRLFDMALSKLEIAQSAAPGSSEAASLYGNALIERSKLKSGDERSNLLRRAFDHYLSISDHERLFYFAKQLHQLAVDERHSQERDKLFHHSSEAYKMALDVRKKLKSIVAASSAVISESTPSSATQTSPTPHAMLQSSSTSPPPSQNTIPSQAVPNATSALPLTVNTNITGVTTPSTASILSTTASTATNSKKRKDVPNGVTASSTSSTTVASTSARRFGDVIPTNTVDARQKNARSAGPPKLREISAPVASGPTTPSRGRTLSRGVESVPAMSVVSTKTTANTDALISTQPTSVQSSPAAAYSSPSTQPGDPEYYLNWGDLYYELGKSKSGNAAKTCFATAGRKYEQSWHEDPQMLLLRAAEVKRQEVMSRMVEACIAESAVSDLASIIAFFDSSPHLNCIDTRECPSLSDSVVHRIAAFQRIPQQILKLDSAPPALLAQGFQVTTMKISGTELSDDIFLSPWPYLASLEVKDCHQFTDLGLVWMSRFSTQLEVLNLSKCVIGNLRMSKDALFSRSSAVSPSLTLYFERQLATQFGSVPGSPLPSNSSQSITAISTNTSKTKQPSSSSTVPASPTKKMSALTASSAPSIATNALPTTNNTAIQAINGVTNVGGVGKEKSSTMGSGSNATSTSAIVNGPNSALLFVLAELHQMPKLVSLNLSDCISLTDLGLYYLVRKSPALTSLNLSGCVGITTNGLVQTFQKRQSRPAPTRLSFDPTSGGGARTSRLLAFQAERKKFLEQQKRQLAESSDTSSASFFLWSAEISPPSTSTPSSTPSSSASSPGSSRASSPTRSSSGSIPKAPIEKKDPPPCPARLCLQSLDLSGCSRVEDEALIWASWSCPDLARLKLAKMPLLTVKSLHFLIENCPLRTLKLGKFADLDDATLNKIALNCPELEQFEVTMAKKVSSAACAHLLQSCPLLCVLTLSFMPQIDDATIYAIAKYLPNLRSLKLSALYKTTNASFGALGAALGTTLNALQLQTCERIDDAGLSQLIVANGNNLRVLQVKDCKTVTSAGLSEVLARCISLTSLTLSKLLLTPPAIKLIGDGLAASGIAPHAKLGLIGNGPLMTAQSLFPASVDPNKVKEDAVDALAKGVSNLTSLDLSWCKIPNEASLDFIFQACPGLTSIDMSNTQLGDRGLNLLVKHCPLLEQVNLGSTKVSDESVLNLLASCGHTLKSLKLNGCWKVSDIVIAKLSKSTPSLNHLNLGWVTKITLVRPIFAHCQTLNTLVLDGLKALTDDIIVLLIHHPETLPNLNLLHINGTDISSSVIFQLRIARPGCVIVHAQK